MITVKKRFDIVALGECMVEFAPEREDKWRMGFAGDAYNTLVYASRLGMRSGFITCIGADMFRARLRAAWREEGVHPVCTKTVTGRQNGVYYIHTNSQGERQFQYYRAGSAATQILKQIPAEKICRTAERAHILYFTAISLAVAESRERLYDVLKKIKGKCLVVFDANYRASLWRSERETGSRCALSCRSST